MDVKLGPDDVAEGELRAYELGDAWVLLTRVEGALHALDDMCNHAGCLLSGGWLEGCEVVCPCHEMRFDVRTGENTSEPRLCEDQPHYPLRVVDGEVIVELPDRRRSA